MADLSIIIVNWNTRELLDACLQSIMQGQSKMRMEVIVVDNASTDGSVELVRSRYPHVRLIENVTNRGFAAANNQAIRVSKGRYILLLNSDTIVLGEGVSRSVEYMDAHADVGAMGCRILNPDRTVQYTCSQFPSLLNLLLMTCGLDRIKQCPRLQRYQMRWWQRDSERDVEVISGCYLMVRRAVVDQVGLLDEAFFFFGEETDWCRRIAKAGWRLVFAPVGEIIHYGGASASRLDHRRDVLLSAATVRLHRKHGGLAQAVAAFLVLCVFHISRAAFWSAVGLTRTQALTRARHFRRVLLDSLECWPREA